MKYVCAALTVLFMLGCRVTTFSSPQCEDNGNGKSQGKDNIKKCQTAPSDDEYTEEEIEDILENASDEEIADFIEENPEYADEIQEVIDEQEEEVVAEQEPIEVAQEVELVTVTSAPTTFTFLEMLIGDSNFNYIGNTTGGPNFGTLRVFHSTTKLYTFVHMVTGVEIGMPFAVGDEIYFSDSACSADAVMTHWYGTLGETKIYAKNGEYYLPQSTTAYSEGAPFVANSKLVSSSNECVETNTEVRTTAVNLVEISQPVNLQSYAPLRYYFE